MEHKFRDDFIKYLHSLTPEERKNFLRDAVADHWGALPPWSTLKSAKIEEVQKATIGCGCALVFLKGGELYAVLLEAGSHYGHGAGKLMIPGGFMDLASGESPIEAVRREVNEEFIFDFFAFDEPRFRPVDMKTLRIKDETRVVIGFSFLLNDIEVEVVQEHIHTLSVDDVYRARISNATMNEFSGKPEVNGARIVRVADIVKDKSVLLHADQASLFEKILKTF